MRETETAGCALWTSVFTKGDRYYSPFPLYHVSIYLVFERILIVTRRYISRNPVLTPVEFLGRGTNYEQSDQGLLRHQQCISLVGELFTIKLIDALTDCSDIEL